MNKRTVGLISMALTTTLSSAPAASADDAAGNVSVTEDLTAVIALQGFPCGPVVSASQQGDNDYIASCQNGNRYRVFANAEGRVVVEKQ